ncbi:hypothetical protein AK88_01099 [Plasmodium fragile]|uniref:Peptidase M14 domain-containing protein n=1 Tax=Plasmodium fragile TaxID=5857 RepID=A0A0D9QTT6_PLAFR|nr:uncharacterized protein AK88_01099 [Plasmodium fragile]KJP89221.1 hypothetical protein AK88_01099 [Plasmodium fragile]
MLIEDEDSGNRLQPFDHHTPGPVYLFRYLGVAEECGQNKGLFSQGFVEEGNKRKQSEGEFPICNNDNEVVKDAPEGNEAKFTSSLTEGEGRRNNVHTSGSSGGSGRRRCNTLEANHLDLIFHDSVKTIYEGTNDAHVEIPTIMGSGRNGGARCHLQKKKQGRQTDHLDDVVPESIHIKDITNKENVPQRIENMKNFLMERLESVNQRNKQLFLQSMRNISEILNYNFLCISKNGHELDPASFAWHDSFVGHVLGEAWKGRAHACLEGVNHEGSQIKTSPHVVKRGRVFIPCGVSNDNTGGSTLLRGDRSVAERNGQEGEEDQGEEFTSPCAANVYGKLKNITCVEEPGLRYKYVYPPNYKPDVTKEVRKVPQGNILFNSKFESANLQYVLKEKNKQVYSIYLNHDVRSNEKKNQWFYFSASYIPDLYYHSHYFEEKKKKKKKKKNEQRCINKIMNEINRHVSLDNNENLKVSFDYSDFFFVNNIKKLEEAFSVKFKIENMSRPYFLYKEGHSPLVFSECRSMKENVLWERAAYNVSYTRNDNPKYFNLKTNTFEKLPYCTYTLEFSYDFLYPYDTVYFASSFPYCYSYLMHYLGLLKGYVHRAQEEKQDAKQKEENKINYLQGTLCTTACGLPCPVVAITNYDKGDAETGGVTVEAETGVARDGDSHNAGTVNTVQNYARLTHMEASHRSSVPAVENPKLLNAASDTPWQCCGGHTYMDDAKCMYNLCHPRGAPRCKEEEDDDPRQRSPLKCSNSFMRQFELLLERHSMQHVTTDDGRRLLRGSTMSPCSISGSTHVVSPSPEGEEKKTPRQPRCEEKKIIFLTARVHPGETNASYVMHGFLSFITSDNAYADALRDNFIFIVIPMLNVDGVILGHNRLCANGFDLNRQWNRPIYYLHQTVHSAKSLIKKINRNGRIVFFCDVHGHSRKYNCFLFGNSDSRSHLRGKKLAEIFPQVLGPSLPWFSAEDTKFKSENINRGVARHVCGREFSIDCSYTFEVSLIGVKMQHHSDGGSPPHAMQMNAAIGATAMNEVREAQEGEEPPTDNPEHEDEFFFYNENVLMLTGISFGISLFKFFNFVSHHKAFISDGGDVVQGEEATTNENDRRENEDAKSDIPPARFKSRCRVQLGGLLPCHRSEVTRSGRKKKGEVVKEAYLKEANLNESVPLGTVAVEPTSQVKSEPVQPTAYVKSHPDGGYPLKGGSRSDSKTYAVSCGSGKCNKREGGGERQVRKHVAKSDSSAGQDQRDVKVKGLSNRRKEAQDDVKESHVQEGHKGGKTHNRAAARKAPTRSMKKKQWVKLLPSKNLFFRSIGAKIYTGSHDKRGSFVKRCLDGTGGSAVKQERRGTLSSGANCRTRHRIKHPCLEEHVDVCEPLQPHGYDPRLGGKKKRFAGHPSGKCPRQRKRPLRITRRKLVMIKRVNFVKGRKANSSPQAMHTKKEGKKVGLSLNHGGLKREYVICLKRKKLKGGLGLIKLFRRKVKPSSVARASHGVVGEAVPFLGGSIKGDTRTKRKRKKKRDSGKGVSSVSTVVNEKREG